MVPALAGVFYDDGVYLALARSLAEGNGYRLQYLPGAPAGVHYPVGYPAFLAALWTAWPSFPANLTLLKAANAVLMGLFASLTVRHLAPRLPVPTWGTAAVVAAACVAVPLMAVATVLFAEPLFLVLAALAVWTADAAGEAEGRRGWALAAAAGALAGLCTLTRSIGVAVLGGVAVALFARRRKHGLVALATGVLLAAPGFAWTAAHARETDPAIVANYGTYGQFLEQAGSGWWTPASLLEVMQPIAALAVPPAPAGLWHAAAAAALALLVWGAVQLAWRSIALGATLVLYAAVVTLWPYGPARFVWVIVPWLAVAFLAGCADLLRRARTFPPRAATATTVAVLAMIVLVATTYAAGQGRGLAAGAPTTVQRGISATMQQVVDWVRARTPPGAVIATEDEALVWLYTGRRAVPSFLWRVRGRTGESLGPDTLRAYLDRTGATHLVLTGLGADAAPDINALMTQAPGYLRLVQVWPGQAFAFAIERP